MKKTVYWSSIEYEYDKKLNTSQNLEGGFVFVFINAFEVRDALESILNELNIQGLLVSQIEFISIYDKKTKWETPKQTKHFKKLYKLALDSTSVIFDDFYAYKKK